MKRFNVSRILLITGLLLAISTTVAGAEQVLLGFSQTDDVSAAVTDLGGSTVKLYQRLKIALVELPEGQLQNVKVKKGVRFAESNASTYQLATIMPWNIEKVSAPLVWQSNIDGRNVRVAVMDTGIDAAHRDLAVDLLSYTALGIDGDALVDVNGHGTHVAGIVAALDNETGVWGVAPAARLFSIKVLNDDGSGTVSALIDGLQWAIDNNIQIVNISLGTKKDSQALREAVEDADDQGLLLVAAAGNAGNNGANNDSVQFPAAYAPVIAVGALDRYDVRATLSATGPALDIMAPGIDIISTWTGVNAYRAGSGTSCAAPHVSGTAALVWAVNPFWTNRQVREQILNSAVPVGDGNPIRYGRGRVDAAAAVGLVSAPTVAGEIAASASTEPSKSGVTINVRAAAGGQALSGAVIALTVRTPSGASFAVNGYTDDNGLAVFAWHIRTQDGKGTYNVRAQVDKAGYVGTVATVSFAN